MALVRDLLGRARGVGPGLWARDQAEGAFHPHGRVGASPRNPIPHNQPKLDLRGLN